MCLFDAPPVKLFVVFMDNRPEKNDSDDRREEMPAVAEISSYAAAEMNGCRKCGRMNPPTRLDCLYCGAELAFDAARRALVKPVMRRLEVWEKGFNLICRAGAGDLGEDVVREIGAVSGRDAAEVRQILEARTLLPLARAGSLAEAEAVAPHLRAAGIETLIVSDEALASETPPRRLRGIEFADDKLVLILFNDDEIRQVRPEELVLIVAGAVFTKRIEATEKRSRKGENKILNTAETASDELLLDLYIENETSGFRVEQKGFDFSGLGAEKGLLAAENMRRLSDRLRKFASGAQFVSDYPKLRAPLGIVWEAEQQNDSQGLKREGFGRFNLGTVTTVSNLSQFTKYSRLQRHLRR